MMLKSGLEPRQGKVVVLVALALIPLIGFVALAVDGGLLLSDQRKTQRAADSAALAAATDLYSKWRTNSGVDPSAGYPAKQSALTTAAANGFSNDTVNSTVTVHIPPTSEPI